VPDLVAFQLARRSRGRGQLSACTVFRANGSPLRAIRELQHPFQSIDMTAINAYKYTAPAKLLHWLTVPALVTEYSIGWLMPHVHRRTRPVDLISLHLSIGALVMLLVLVRLLWRCTHPSTPELKTPPLSQWLARATHRLLYLLLFAFPLMGWVNASSRGWGMSLFGVVPLPPLSAAGSPLGHAFGSLHKPTAWVLVALIALHLTGALYHHVVAKDDTLRRMLPARRP
jgi:cytochrome b561